MKYTNSYRAIVTNNFKRNLIASENVFGIQNNYLVILNLFRFTIDFLGALNKY